MTIEDYASLVEKRLDRILPQADDNEMSALKAGCVPALLENAMRYSVMAGGKRLRPSMLLAAADMLSVDREAAMPFACALEMIHTYSLIHDDLPGMDNDTLRRGRPTNHVVFGEGQAILAGDGLLSEAFSLMTEAVIRGLPGVDQTAGLLAMREIVDGAGIRGMVGGQCADLYAEERRCADADMLAYIHAEKTARMLTSPLRCAARLAGLSDDSPLMKALTHYGQTFGLIFQIVDDILDVQGDSRVLGKSIGKDEQNGKLTYVTLYGLDGAKARVRQLESLALTDAASLGSGSVFFTELLTDMTLRTK